MTTMITIADGKSPAKIKYQGKSDSGLPCFSNLLPHQIAYPNIRHTKFAAILAAMISAKLSTLESLVGLPIVSLAGQFRHD